jgi:hypothetical protein
MGFNGVLPFLESGFFNYAFYLRPYCHAAVEPHGFNKA